MNLFTLSYRSLMSRPLSTALSLVLLSLGVGMIAFLVQVNHHVQQQLENQVRGIDMVVGAKGSPLQLILSAVYHLDAPTGNISLEEAERLRAHPLVASGIPLAYGDSYQGYRIVGTTDQYPQLYDATVARGRLWQAPFEVTLGATVAENLHLKVGDTFAGTHGLEEGGEAHEAHAYRVVGLLDYTYSVLDQLILTATESVWEIHHHEEGEEADPLEHEAHEEEAELGEEAHPLDHEEHKKEAEREITAMLIRFRSPLGMVQLPRMVNQDTNMQAAVPVYEISRLFSLIGVGVDTLQALALVIMSVSGLSVFISLYTALSERIYEMALMRTYGATRWQLVGLIVQEGLLLTGSGFLLGMLFSRIGLWLVSHLMEAGYHYPFSGGAWLPEEGWLLVIALGLGLLASLLPAIRVFHLNLSKTLADA
ncbi:putative ABC transport system permease protein [Catalinimonas alkaloidigena]|uniref:Putative ABC transport system permease protein n=1 Tax=Catalinimonas alkaloidigena TaxID=1075417 RepID=A0A1G9VF41_9BACT|nr:ABC transporter permease [Catalinimonas alkaloidigena]SDM70878.1 putative ABC transport system permease protein [Catalinimonas alkaloidigena]